MNKLFTMAAFAVFSSVVSFGQITQINANNSLEVVAPLNGVKSIFSSATQQTLWVSEGTLASTIQLSPTILFVESGGLVNGKLLFTGQTAATGEELYITDGTPGGTVLVKDIFPGPNSSKPADFVWMNGFWYFSAETDLEGRELWRTNGTEGGTTFIKDINTGTGSSNGDNQYDPIVNGNYFLFAAKGVSGGLELWKSDGTTGGTMLLKDINPGADSSSPSEFYLFNNLVLFTAKTAANGREFWRSDGTPDGTFMLKDIHVGPGSSAEIELFPGFSFPILSGYFIFQGRVYFQATDGTNNGNVYGTDGSTLNTTLLKTVISGPSFPFILLMDAVKLSDRFIFPVADDAVGASLWQSNGTTGGTTVFKSFDLPPGGQVPFIMIDFNAYMSGYTQNLFQGNKFFFAAATVTEGYELWISDGTLPGTHLVKDINPGDKDGLGSISYIHTSDALYFAAGNEVIGNELWRTDGTDVGTTLVKDIRLNNPDSDPEMMIINNGKVFFGANDGVTPSETDLFVLDGIFSPLPSKLATFTVTEAGPDALLQWQTLQEVNTSHFILQRSTDAIRFQDIGTINAAGNSNAPLSYRYTDVKVVMPPGGTLYYRLVTSDKEGKKDYSKVVTFSRNTGLWNASLLGNANNGVVNVVLTGVKDGVQIQIYDVSGRQLFNQKFGSSQSTIAIPVQGLSKGVYTISVLNGKELKTIRFVK